MELDIFKVASEMAKTDSIRVRGIQLVKRLVSITRQYADTEDIYVKKTLEQADAFLVDFENDKR